ncbi:MAG TPA: glycosyltransferase family 87 protein, partial [Chloroflexaceae bacterium]|nr:glycosyltransferase family 87 protein [Chloroflexaceae bacterium]
PAAGRPWLAGPLWSLMALVKVYPAALALPELLRGRWRLVGAGAVGAAAVVLLSGALLGWGQEAAFWREVVPSLGARTTRLSNQSLYGLIGRTLDPGSIDSDNRATELPLAAALHAPLALLALGATGWAVWRRRGVAGFEARLATASAVTCAVLLAIPVSWDHYQALLLLPLLAACAVVLREPGRGPWLLGALTLLAFGTYKHVQNGLIDSDVVLLLASYRTLGLALLWAWWLRLLWEQAAGQTDHDGTISP